LLQNLARDGAAILDPRGKAGSRGTIPERISGSLGKGADIEFGQACVGEWSENGVLLGGALAGAIVACVIGVHAIGDLGKA